MEKNTSTLIRLYLELDILLLNLYQRLGRKRKFPLPLRKMWQGLAKDEKEHIFYWRYLKKKQYCLDIFHPKEIKIYKRKIEQLIKELERIKKDDSMSLEKYFDLTVNIEFAALVSPMQKCFYNHDIILGKTVFNPYKKYNLHLKRITAIAERIYIKNPVKLTLINSFREIKEENDKMIIETVNDSLTGVKSRKYFFNNAHFLLEVARREKKPVAVVMLDINKFKKINDSYGHLTGDKVLKEMGSFLKKRIRASDIVARYGGDEFVLLLYNQNKGKVDRFLSRFKQELSMLKIMISGKKYIQPEASFGYAVYHPGKRTNLYQLLSQADKEMYINKHR